jgi:hypothetical protein
VRDRRRKVEDCRARTMVRGEKFEMNTRPPFPVGPLEDVVRELKVLLVSTLTKSEAARSLQLHRDGWRVVISPCLHGLDQ